MLARVCSATLLLFSSLPQFVSKTQSMSVRDVGHYSLCLLLWRSSVHHAAQVVHSFRCVFCTAKFAILLMNLKNVLYFNFTCVTMCMEMSLPL